MCSLAIDRLFGHRTVPVDFIYSPREFSVSTTFWPASRVVLVTGERSGLSSIRLRIDVGIWILLPFPHPSRQDILYSFLLQNLPFDFYNLKKFLTPDFLTLRTKWITTRLKLNYCLSWGPFVSKTEAWEGFGFRGETLGLWFWWGTNVVWRGLWVPLGAVHAQVVEGRLHE